MSTRGDYTIVKGGRYYSCYQHTGMHPQGNPAQLVAEAADIARNGDWGDVIAGWTTKAWVDDAADENLPDSPAVRAAAESHPDGDTAPDQWAYALRPRLSRAETAGEHDEERASDVFGPGPYAGSSPIHGRPSWRAGAAMPVMMKNNVYGAGDRDLGVYVDADNRELVLVRYDGAGGTRPVAAAPLDDPGALRALAEKMADREWADAFWGAPAAETARPWSFSGREGPDGVADGMWRRPAGFPPLEGAPRSYPARRGGPFVPRRLRPRTAAQLDYRSLDAVTGPLEPLAAAGAAGDGGIGAAVGGAAPAGPGGGPGGPRCSHVGVKSRRRCTRPAHTDRRHRYD